MSLKQHTDQRGFTIVELLIATTVLSVILLLATVMITSIGNLYYKGVNSARIQNDTRSITDELTRNLQLSDGLYYTAPNDHGVGAYCINNVRYTYIIGKQLGPDLTTQSKHVLWRDVTDPGTCDPVDLANIPADADGTELIAPNSRLVKFSISTDTSVPYKVDIGLAYGDDDLLCSPSSTQPTCDGSHDMTAADYKNGDLICKGGKGSSFCSTTTLSTLVVKRITGH